MNYTSLVFLWKLHHTHLNVLLSGNILYFIYVHVCVCVCVYIYILLLQELYSSVRSLIDKHYVEVKSMKCHYQFVFVNHSPRSKIIIKSLF